MTSKLKPDGSDFTPTIHTDTYPTISPTRLSLAGKSVFITGASKGIGRATALSFARAGASFIALGARSSLTSLSHDLALAAQEAGRPVPKIVIVTLDVTDGASVEAAAKEVAREFDGRLDILINNAGVFEEHRTIGESKPEGWWGTFCVNLQGTYLVTRAFLPLVLRGTSKTLIAVSSVGAHWLFPACSAYQTSKLALLRFTEFVDVEYSGQGILSIAVHPGNVETEILAKWPSEEHNAVKHTETAALAGDTMVWLCGGGGGERKDWLAGRYVSCTWDMEELESRREEIVRGDLLKVRLAI